MQEYRDNDTHYVLTRKILQNQTDLKSSIDAITIAIGGSGSTQIITLNDVVVAIAGTAVQVQSQACKGVAIVARIGNTGYVYVGGSTTTNGSGTRRGIILVAGGMPPQIIPVSNSNEIWINADTANDAVGIMAYA
jgi:hypothetical protein